MHITVLKMRLCLTQLRVIRFRWVALEHCAEHSFALVRIVMCL